MKQYNAFKNFDSRQLYRFFVDGRFYTTENGWVGYEQREPGSIEGMSLAYCHMLDNFDLKDGLTIKYVCKLHDLIIHKIDTRARKNRYPGQLREFQVSFLLKPRTTSLDGLKELLMEQGITDGLKQIPNTTYTSIDDIYHRIINNEAVRYRAIVGDLESDLMKAFEDKTPENLYSLARKKIQQNLHGRLENLLDKYNKEINFYKGDDKLYYIVDFIKKTVRLHPFVDANARVFINVLLNHLLMLNGYFPVIFEEPSIFDAYTTNEILVEIQTGQSLVNTLLNKPSAKVFGHSIDDESHENHTMILKLMSAIIHKLSSIKD